MEQININSFGEGRLASLDELQAPESQAALTMAEIEAQKAEQDRIDEQAAEMILSGLFCEGEPWAW